MITDGERECASSSPQLEFLGSQAEPAAAPASALEQPAAHRAPAKKAAAEEVKAMGEDAMAVLARMAQAEPGETLLVRKLADGTLAVAEWPGVASGG